MYNPPKLKFIVLYLALILHFNSSAQTHPTHFKSDIDFGNGTVFSTFFDVKIHKDAFAITSPKNADVRLFGSKAKLGRALGKSPKKGIIVNIIGQRKKDSLFGETKIPMFGKLTFKGIVKQNSLQGELLKNTTVVGSIVGIASDEKKISYSYLYPMLLKTVQDNIYSKSVLMSAEWHDFENELKKLCNNAHDDIELFLGFNTLNQKLPFTHLNLIIQQEDAADDITVSQVKSVFFEEKNTNTAYLKIKNFSSTTAELAAILPTIVANQNYKNLIVDLRDNPGGGIDAAFEFAKYITTEDMQVGYFLTNKLNYTGYEPELFATLPELQPNSTKDFTDELKVSRGVKLIFKKPNNPVFSGKLYVLTNGGTGSTCEPVVYAFKDTKKAVIIGEKTYGGMLSACPYVVSGKYTLMLPMADFYTYDGVRLDKVGVEPDIAVKSEEALNKALEMIGSSTD